MEGSENASYYEGVFDDAEEIEVEEVVEEEIDEDTYGLIYLGELTSITTIGNHRFKLKTLKIGEELDASMLAKRYEGSVDSNRAIATALVAASIVSVDGDELVATIGPNDKVLDAKFQYIIENWYWPTVATLYSEYDALLTRALKVFDEIKKG